MKSIIEEIQFIKKRNKILRQLEELAEQEGMLRVESDAFEEYTSYVQSNPRQDANKLVKVADLQGDVYLLKPDITTNLIKQVIPRMEQDLGLSLYYLDTVYAFNDFGSITPTRQFGIEVIGASQIDEDFRLISFITRLFDQYNITYNIELGNQQWINDVIEQLQASKTIANLIKKALIDKNKEGIKQYVSNPGYQTLLLTVIQRQNDIPAYIDIIQQYNLPKTLHTQLLELHELVNRLDNPNIEVDLSLLNEFDYYNGIIYRGYVNSYKTNILRGGRYDSITQEFGTLTPALGFSLDVDIFINEVITK
ncbi:ATP phosphoribosyltransferase regulatory subunit [Candidatus Xianfuyuplasma coldseepsis]|uniref:Class II Histidinyl-tRNA synthetase (HisRS)-like catalytic core domain-containing protein n=1 Tax=Candidatus Xianfuyuplasma coldseepsis TaxID=2782163 RepID=A0A7L7KSM3_9MOLU|nr:ATP phosphoribosyltransferase regulatory subunit [Xianfuyuplasma coldseepsis]QMS84778.1 hypothetical protein G4Z02_03090 [Xianfuyuplasma coldseepsis]